MHQWPDAYARVSPINQALYPKSAWLRERVWRTLRDCMELTPERKTTMADAARLSGQTRDIFMDFDLMLLDNCRLDANQLASIHNLMSLIPSGLHNLRSISVRDFLGTAPSNVSLDGQPGAVNIFGVPVGTGGPVENSFPSDVPAGWIKLFCGALSLNTHAPVLNATVTGQMLELSWPELPLGYTLESSPTMAEGTWQPVTNSTTQSDGRLRLTLPITGGSRFFRLRSP